MWLRVGQALLDLPGRIEEVVVAPRESPPAVRCERREIEQVVRRSPRANAYLALERGLHVYKHRSAVACFAASGPSLFIVGGVHGPRREWRPLLESLIQAASQRGYRRILLFPVARDGRDLVAGAGFESIQVGSEGFVSPRTYTLAGKERERLRQMWNRARREGVTVSEETGEAAISSLRPLYTTWLRERPGGGQMRLLVGTPGFDAPLRRRYFVARVDGAPVAFVTLTPGWDGDGWGLDVMARDPRAPAGAMDALIVEIIQRLGDEGRHTLSLAACPMYAPSGRLDVGDPALRALFSRIYTSRPTNRIYRFRSLARFKRKFAPTWEPIYIAAWPRVSWWSLYVGCRMWGLLGDAAFEPAAPPRPLGSRIASEATS